jgi:hypothetical protein
VRQSEAFDWDPVSGQQDKHRAADPLLAAAALRKTALNRPRIHHRCDGEPDTNVIFWSAT